ncbi:MAG: TIGR01620 family protein [Pseudomonadota bacterium]
MTRKPIAFDMDALEPRDDVQTSKPKKPTKAAQTAKAAKPAKPRAPRATVDLVLEDVPDPFEDAAPKGPELEDLEPDTTHLRSSGLTFGKLFLGALGILVSLALGLWVDGLVRSLLAAWPPLGWFALGLALLVLLIALGFAVRELIALRRLARMDVLRQEVDDSRAAGDSAAASAIVGKLTNLYADRPETAAGRGELEAHAGDIMSADTRLDLAERALLASLDAKAQSLITASAGRVAMVTAVSPRALVDIGYVMVENMRLIRRMAELYGLRPGLFGSLRLTAAVISHLAVTGTIAVGDGLVHQAIGTGVAAKLSARFGEGVVNGLLTARIGISAADLCRPMPFHALARPRISDFVNPLTALSRQKDK